MSTITAQILVGQADPNHGGINPTHYLFLSENSRPAWSLVSQNIFDVDTKTIDKKILWIPTLENMLEDALLMIAIHVIKEEKIIELAKSYFNKKNNDKIEMYEDVSSKHLNDLYEKCRSLDNIYKLVITVLEGSTIEKQLPILEKYKMDVEICKTKYSRSYSTWDRKLKIKGSIIEFSIEEEELIAMANDPAIQAEIAAINREFAVAEMDGLERL